MLTRRTFIKSTLAAYTALATPAALALTAIKNDDNKQPLLIFADENSTDADLFAQQFGKLTSIIGRDIGLHFDTFNTFCSENPDGWVSGITRDSDFFVLQQLAAQQGYHTAYSATHTVSDNLLSHRVMSNNEKAPLLAKALSHAGAKWPAWLADNIANLHNTTVADSTSDSQASFLSQAKAHHVLVSWLFVPSHSTLS